MTFTAENFSPGTVTLSGSGIQGPEGSTFVSLERRNPDGTWAPVRGAEAVPLVGGGFIGEDNEAPLGREVRFRANYSAAQPIIAGDWVFATSNLDWYGDAAEPLLGPRTPHYNDYIQIRQENPSTTDTQWQRVLAPMGDAFQVRAGEQYDFSVALKSWSWVNNTFGEAAARLELVSPHTTPATTIPSPEGFQPLSTQMSASITIGPEHDGLWVVPALRFPHLAENDWVRLTRLTLTGSAMASEDTSVTTAPPSRWGLALLDNVYDPASRLEVYVAEMGEVERSSNVSIYNVVNSPYPVAVQSTQGARTGSLQLAVRDLDDRDTLWAMLANSTSLLLRTTRQFGVDNMHMAVTTITEQRVSRLGYQPHRLFDVEYVETLPPAGTTISGALNSWLLVSNTYASWADVLDNRPTWSKLLTVPVET